MITATCDETSNRPLVIITYASVGSGHRSAAQATAQALEDLSTGSTTSPGIAPLRGVCCGAAVRHGRHSCSRPSPK